MSGRMGPPVPGWIDRVNFITSYFWQGCEAPFGLFCEFAAPLSGRAVALLIGIDIDDIVKTFWRPAGLRSHRHGRKGARGRKKPFQLPDVNEEIGKRIPGQKEIAGRRYGSATRYFFEVTDVLDRVAFNVAIFDVVSDTVYQSLLGIISVDNTNCPHVARGRAHFLRNDLNSYADEWRPKNNSYLDYEIGVDMVQFGVDIDPKRTYLAAYECHFKNEASDLPKVAIAFGDGDGSPIFEETGLVTLERGDETVLSISGTVTGVANLTWFYKSFGGFTVSNFSNVSIFSLD